MPYRATDDPSGTLTSHVAGQEVNLAQLFFQSLGFPETVFRLIGSCTSHEGARNRAPNASPRGRQTWTWFPVVFAMIKQVFIRAIRDPSRFISET